MSIRFYSDLTGESYSTEEKALEAEKEYNKRHEEENKKEEERKKRLQEIEDAKREVIEAKKKLNNLIDSYREDYSVDNSDPLRDFFNFLGSIFE